MKRITTFSKQYALAALLFFIGGALFAQTPPGAAPPPKDSTEVAIQRDSINLKYPFKSGSKSKLFLLNPSTSEVIYDTETGKYMLVERIGDYYVKSPLILTQEEYKNYRLKEDINKYYKEKISAASGRKKGSETAQKDLLPTYYVNSNFFESVFGGNTIDVNPQGSILVRMGGLYQKVDNPQLAERNRSSFTFDFDQEISASISAQIGTRLRIGAQYDTQSTFNFQNQIKLEYTPTEDDIIQNIEAGNISMPIKNSLITGAQSLFGFKTQLQFGKTTITGVFAEQNSETRSVAAQGGSTIQEFELQATDYDNNRHFFLSHYFRDQYDTALQEFPLINSSINITRIEVWVTNRTANTENIRNIVGLTDIGEALDKNIGPANVNPKPGAFLPDNKANDIEDILTPNNAVRKIATVGDGLAPYGMQQGRDYSVLENAIKLNPTDYVVHPQLGYISLNRRLADNDVLAVAFEYTVSGDPNVYRVGEFTTDGIIAPDNIVVKLLRSEIISKEIPMWDLLMKNIYSLQAFRMEREGFRFELLYRDDATGVPINILQNATSPGIADRTLMNIFDIDRLDQSLFYTPEGDGYFDYVEGITVNSERGYIIFPTVEPFGAKSLADDFITDQDQVYVFDELYRYTQTEAKNIFQQKDKYFLKGYHKSDNSSGIPLGAFNVPQGSVRVTSGGRELVEGVDYVVDYQMGRVQIVNPSLEASNAPIEVSVENNATFNLQTKRFFGVDVEHRFSDNFIAGATILNLRERPLTQKAILGQEPINNTIFGLNANFSTEVPKFTKWVNKLPNIDTDVPSNFSVRGDFAFLKPGSPKRIEQGGEATSYVDDFEGSQIPLEIKTIQQWFMASTPQYQSQFDFNGNASDLSYGYKRGRLAWYIIDPLFYGGTSLKPGNISNEELSRAEVRRISYQELFPEQDLDLTQSTIVRTLDLAFYPNERGSNNFDTSNVGPDGKFTNPEDRWAGITRALTTTNFEQSNVEYIQFWLMDPYDHYSISAAEGLPAGVNPNDPSNQVGELYFNLGNISEDILKDGRKMYENGLPANPLNDNVTDPTIWGKIPTNQSLLYAFGDSDAERLSQDVGLDGLNDEEELAQFGTQFGPDPSNDNYEYFRSSNHDANGASILSRYKRYNNTQGNSPTSSLSTESYPTSATTFPDVEDIDKDQTMNAVESYYQYKVSLNKNDLVVGRNNIVDEKRVTVELADGSRKDFRWLQFRIQVTNPDEIINDITGFNSIRFMRIFLTKFKMPVVLRFGELQLVRGDWRRFTKTLDENIDPPEDLDIDDLQKFEVGVVNIQENENRVPIPYVIPPGIQREVLRGSTAIQRQNEQSLTVKVTELEPNAARGIYKNVSVDLRMYKQFRMFLHAEGIQIQPQVENEEIAAIVRLGSDINDNYYQLEKKLVITDYGATTPSEIWPEENNLHVLLKYLGELKLLRFEQGVAPNVLFPAEGETTPIEGLEGYEIRVKGNPNLANIRTILLGVKNISDEPQSAEVWFNEMRVAEFDNDGGWAGVVSADANFADFADVAVTGRMETIGFGGIEQTVNERTQEDMRLYDLVTNVNAGQLLPKNWGVKIPVNYSISEEVRDPKYDPQYQDVLFNDAKDINPNSKSARDYTKRTSFSLINVRKEYDPNAEKKQRFYDVENLTVSYAYNEVNHKDYNVQLFTDQNVRASANYNYNFTPFVVEPFKNTSLFDNRFLRLIKDINFDLLPTNISVNSNIIRSYNQQLSRSLIEGLPELPTLTQRFYMFDWDYNLTYNLSKSLQVNFGATNNYIYDNFDRDQDVKIFDNFFNAGREDHYRQSLGVNYQLPLDKIPYLDFLSADYSYTADFDWQAASQSYVDKIGNVVQNSNTHALGTDIEFTALYTSTGLSKMDKRVVNNMSETTKKQQSFGKKLGYIAYDLLTMAKSGRLNYTENNGTYLPGYIPKVGFLGRDNFNGGLAPSLGFVFGSQIDIRQKAIENGWLISRDVNDPYYNRTYSQSHFNKLDYNLFLEPFRDFDIQLRASKTLTENTFQQIDVINGILNEDSPITSYGNFSISYNLLGTSFKNADAIFEEFKANRAIIAQRLANDSGAAIEGFGLTSQQVSLPAFIAAYTGKDANSSSMESMKSFPVPGWDINYKGLMNLKWFKKNFRSFSIAHSYNSLYSIVNFRNNLDYDASDPFGKTDISGNYFSETLYTNVNMIEEFSPLIKLDFRMKNSVSFTGQINKDRGLTLNFNNNTITQILGTEYLFGIGYRIKDLPMRFNFGGGVTKLKGDLNLKADISLRDSETIIRAIDQENNQVTGGQKLLAIKIYADYALTQSLTSSFYYEQSSSRYAVSTTFPRQSISAGISVRYVLGNN